MRITKQENGTAKEPKKVKLSAETRRLKVYSKFSVDGINKPIIMLQGE